MHGNSNIRVK